MNRLSTCLCMWIIIFLKESGEIGEIYYKKGATGYSDAFDHYNYLFWSDEPCTI